MKAQFPTGAWCAICTRPCVGELHQEPLGRDGALVNVCSKCRDEVPAERDHLLGGGSSGLGDGNRQLGRRHR